MYVFYLSLDPATLLEHTDVDWNCGEILIIVEARR